MNYLTDGQASRRTSESFPKSSLRLLNQKYLDLGAGLCLSDQACRKDLCVIDHKYVVRFEVSSKVSKLPVRDAARRSFHEQHSGSFATLGGHLGDEFLRQVIIKLGDLHVIYNSSFALV